MVLASCIAVFALAYLLNIVTITVGYHRGLAHRAVWLRPGARRALILVGNWITGLDPKAWVVMHRMHHEHSDTPLDPHSPANVGILGIGAEQLRSYKRVIVGLARKEPAFMKHAADLDFPLSRVNTKRLWVLPYLLHATIGLVLGLTVHWGIGVAYYAGMVSHPIQGGLVNAFGHAIGGRNFDTPDQSRNNHLVAWLVLGEGFQNNHHRYPASARFSYRAHEVDLGYAWCLLLEKLGVLRIERAHLAPRPGAMVESSAAGEVDAGGAAVRS